MSRSLAAVLGHEFTRPDLLDQALTHPSAAAGSAYERLEFLGDRVLGLAVADMVFRAFPAEPEGRLARRFAALVRKETLVRVAEAVGLGAHLRLSKSEAEQGGRTSGNLLADACEAVIGALYLDGGYETARRFIEHQWQPLMAEQSEPPQDAKTALQEWAQGHGLALPLYRLLGSEGPPHDPTFEIEVSLPGYLPAQGRGRSRRAAEAAAAAALYERIRIKSHG